MSTTKIIHSSEQSLMLKYFTLILIALPLFVSAQESNNPAPSETETSQEEQEQPPSKTNNPSSHQGNTNKPPLVINEIKPEIHEIETYEITESSDNPPATDRRCWDIIFSGLMTLFTLVLAISTVYLYKVTRKAANAAEKAANVAIKSERAQIYISEPIVSVETDPSLTCKNKNITTLRFDFNVNNIGRSAASISECIVKFTIAGDESFSDIAGDDFVERKVLNQIKTRITKITIPNPVCAGSFPISKIIRKNTQDWNDVVNFNKYLFVHGYIKYADIFGETHEASFGYRYLSPPSGTIAEAFLSPLSHASYWHYN